MKHKAYSFFVKDAVAPDEDPLKNTTSTLVLGRAEFIENILRRVGCGNGKQQV